LALISLKDSES